MFHNPHYLIGCPVWACADWKGSLFSRQAPRSRWLRQYSQVFNSVEGNSTFYGIPALDTFARWAAETEDGFRFCLKFPRSISHDAQLLHVESELDKFLDGLQILATAERLGPTMLQLGPQFSPAQWDSLERFLNLLPVEFEYAVEVRHPDWFENPNQQRLNELLTEQQINRVIFDSNALFSAPPTDEIEAASQRRKPRVPVRTRTTGSSPLLRLIGRNVLEADAIEKAIDSWTEIVALWIDRGDRPIVYTHTPDDAMAPEFARRFHNRLADRVPGLNPVDGWPFDIADQKSLF